MCPHCGYAHPVTTLPPCAACGRMDCVHNPDPPHTIENGRPQCAGYQAVLGEGWEGGGGEFGGGGATSGW
jgi:hypothetical protein